MGRPKRTLEQCQQYARTKSDECLALEYINEDGKLPWRCCQNHIWSATSASVVGQNSWCKRCADEKSAIKRRGYTLEDCIALAASKGGWCIAAEYPGSKTKMPWKCSCGYVWEAAYGGVVKGTWCLPCANARKRKQNHLGIEKIPLAPCRRQRNADMVRRSCQARHGSDRSARHTAQAHWRARS